MRILALDTATEACSVALLTDDAIIGCRRDVGRGHAEVILGMVDAILSEGGVTPGMLDAIAASVGPGSFTGVRICVSVTQGLAFGAGLPVIAVSTLEALAAQAMQRGASSVLACMDARMGEVYWGCFAADAAHFLRRLGDMSVGAVNTVSTPFVGRYEGIGRGFAAYPSLAARVGVLLPAGADQALPDAREVAALGAIRLRMGLTLDPAELLPQYLRDKVALTEAERGVKRADLPTPDPQTSNDRQVIE